MYKRARNNIGQDGKISVWNMMLGISYFVRIAVCLRADFFDKNVNFDKMWQRGRMRYTEQSARSWEALKNREFCFANLPTHPRRRRLSVYLLIRMISQQTATARITKLDIEMSHPESWVLETHLLWNEKVEGQSHEAQETVPAWVLALLWVLASSGWFCAPINMAETIKDIWSIMFPPLCWHRRVAL